MATRIRVTDPTFTNRALSMGEIRKGMEALVMPAAGGKARGGIMPGSASGSQFAGPTSTPSMKSVVGAFQAAVTRDGEGVWLVNSDVNITIDHPAPNSTNPRIDLIVVRVYDTEAGDVIPSDVAPGTTQTGIAVVEVISGSPAASPIVPTIPVNAELIKQVNVPAGASAVLNSTAYGRNGQITVARGGVVVVEDAAEREALWKYSGLHVYQRDIAKTIYRVGSSWRLASAEMYRNTGMDTGQNLLGNGWLGTAYGWNEFSLGSKIVIPADGISRDVAIFGDVQILGDGWFRLRCDVAGGVTSTWPNPTGKHRLGVSPGEDTFSIKGGLSLDGTKQATIYLEARSEVAVSASFRVPSLLVIAT